MTRQLYIVTGTPCPHYHWWVGHFSLEAKMDNDCQTISVRDAGKILGVSRNTAYEAVRTKQLPALRIGRASRS